jgi:hypothetical protein
MALGVLYLIFIRLLGLLLLLSRSEDAKNVEILVLRRARRPRPAPAGQAAPSPPRHPRRPHGLAPPTAAPEVEAEARQDRTPTHLQGSHRTHPAPGQREPGMGLHLHTGRTAAPRPPRRSLHHPPHPAQRRPGPRTPTKPQHPHLAGVPSRPGIRTARRRLLPHRHRGPATPVRVLRPEVGTRTTHIPLSAAPAIPPRPTTRAPTTTPTSSPSPHNAPSATTSSADSSASTAGPLDGDQAAAERPSQFAGVLAPYRAEVTCPEGRGQRRTPGMAARCAYTGSQPGGRPPAQTVVTAPRRRNGRAGEEAACGWLT